MKNERVEETQDQNKEEGTKAEESNGEDGEVNKDEKAST